eukprot:TRINITY_DN1641_c0_g1_i1.p1 TRINITY_DN1641_c0_g1~~TRINITY_DN1641_c0_g1_i1.p1  ORF type:complete len:788 (+),score=199.05 TRINITY_DN1641_c0_g1_i1:71-2434(+)
MQKIFRSADIERVELLIQKHVSKEFVSRLGTLELCELIDINTHLNPLQKAFTSQIVHCDNSLRNLRYFEQKHKEFMDEFPYYKPISLSRQNEEDYRLSFEDLSITLNQLTNEVKTLSQNHEAILRDLEINIENKSVQLLTSSFLYDEKTLMQPLSINSKDIHQPLISYSFGSTVPYLVGVIGATKIGSLKKTVYKLTRGNCVVKSVEIPYDFTHDALNTGDSNRHVVLIVFSGNYSQDKLKKLAETFGTRFYTFMEGIKSRQYIDDLENQISSMEMMLQPGLKQIRKIVVRVGAVMDQWEYTINREREIFITLNKFKYDQKETLIGEAFIPKDKLQQLSSLLCEMNDVYTATVPSSFLIKPYYGVFPTYFPTNKYVEGFHSVVSGYGTARFKEVNPTLLTLVTFPFLFAIMYGDLGHGFILFLIGLLIVLNEKKIANIPSIRYNEMFSYLYEGRYLILMMGIWSMFCGAVYNDFMGLPMTIFSSHWTLENNETFVPINGTGPCIFGFDPSIRQSQFDIIYANSFKMKMSIIVGVTHMMIGVFFSCFNLLKFKTYYKIFTQFIPQVLFFGSFFGYLVFLIMYKWLFPKDISLLAVLMNFVMNLGGMGDLPELFGSQAQIQKVLFVILVSCVPILFFSTPIVHSIIKKIQDRSVDYLSAESNVSHEKEEDDENIFMETIIETIEFLLSTLSHTASFLRLWALSLAHSQLSDVFYNMLFAKGLVAPTPVIMVFAFLLWAFATIFILLVLEGLSAFLHALRLHWVEFMSKFYKGDGVPLKPFNLSKDSLLH